MNDDRITREKDFHDDRFGGDDNVRKGAAKYYSIMVTARKYYMEIASGYCKGKHLLEFGCGTGSPITWVKKQAIVTGIDISSAAIKKANEKAITNDIKANYYVMNAEKTEFNDNSFDVVVGTGILHHLDIDKAYAELSRILNIQGHSFFIEPLGHNPFINLYRQLTPTMRTEDEHPLTIDDIQLSKKYFDNVSVRYFNILSILAVPFRNTKYFSKIKNFLEELDGVLMFLLPFIKKYAWVVVICLSSPKKRDI